MKVLGTKVSPSMKSLILHTHLRAVLSDWLSVEDVPPLGASSPMSPSLVQSPVLPPSFVKVTLILQLKGQRVLNTHFYCYILSFSKSTEDQTGSVPDDQVICGIRCSSKMENLQSLFFFYRLLHFQTSSCNIICLFLPQMWSLFSVGLAAAIMGTASAIGLTVSVIRAIIHSGRSLLTHCRFPDAISYSSITNECPFDPTRIYVSAQGRSD